jgi:hypothetical protein
MRRVGRVASAGFGHRAGIDKCLVDPALVAGLGEECIEQRQVGSGIDLQVQDVLWSGLSLADRDRRGPAGRR